ncbi:hypothetical protein [Saccharopolyspora gloriosae]|uniref:hypothetical protein n=1 Tax=Saccharopolyspora gloriosae TaxID=455344 RepID=UPI001FB7397C|nr:hypothetical protein [Saccharopolyspora gloriosae]
MTEHTTTITISTRALDTATNDYEAVGAALKAVIDAPNSEARENELYVLAHRSTALADAYRALAGACVFHRGLFFALRAAGQHYDDVARENTARAGRLKTLRQLEEA